MLENYVAKENYRGWDPYDALCSKRIPKSFLKNKLFAMLLIQLNLYSPINFRTILKINKGTSNKALALFSRSYFILGNIFRETSYLDKGFRLLNELLANIRESCNAYYFPYVAPKHSLGPDIEDIICVTETMKTISSALKYRKEDELENNIKFLIEKLLKKFLVEKRDFAYFKYTPHEEGKIVFNVSALALESLSEVMNLKLHSEYDLFVLINKIVKFLIKNQRDDGAWPYSIYTEKGKYYWQIDFHQGFIIDGLNSILPYLDGKLRTETENALNKAIRFYMEKQFTKDGYSYYRYPFKYPIDIHNQAQGIITFSKLYKTRGEEKYLDFAKKIALWTIKNMQSPEGYFYAHKWPFFVNKIPYMRWGQAWMMLALATLLEVLRE